MSWLATVVISQEIQRWVRRLMSQRLAKRQVTALNDVTTAALARYGTRFSEDMVRNAARSAFLSYRPGRYRSAPARPAA